MRTPSSKVSSVAICIALMVLISRTAGAQGDQMILKQLKDTMAIVRTSGPPSMARTNAAERLADLTSKVNPDRVDDKTLQDLVSLLDTSDDSVRYWVATSLGNLGPRAKIAIPRLLKILAEVECLQQSKTSEGGVRYALKKMGVNPPQANCGAASK
jgi:hypothetical protein